MIYNYAYSHTCLWWHSRHMYSCCTVTPILCEDGHGWLPSHHLYRNCKSGGVMVKRQGSIYLFYMGTVPLQLPPVLDNQYSSVCTRAQACMLNFFIFLHTIEVTDMSYIAYRSIIYSSKLQCDISILIVFNQVLYSCVRNC